MYVLVAKTTIFLEMGELSNRGTDNPYSLLSVHVHDGYGPVCEILVLIVCAKVC